MNDLRTGRIEANGKGDANDILKTRVEYGDAGSAEDWKLFVAQLRSARTKTLALNARSAFDSAAITRDQLIFPVQATNLCWHE
jgi:hypothetical protein